MTTPEIELGMDSYPPSLWGGQPMAAPAPAAALRAGSQPPSLRLTVSPGAPGGYSPAVKAADRPRNVTELAERAQLVDTMPWPAGQFVPVGISGKRAHWTGREWKGGESPGYAGFTLTEPPPLATAPPAPPVTEPPVALREVPQFPYRGDDGAEDLHR